MNDSTLDPSPEPGGPTPAGSPHRYRKGLAAGLAVGLLGGTAAGMAFGVPGLSSAASVVEQATATTEPDTTAPGDTDGGDVEDRVEQFAERAVAHLRDRLQDLVDDGTLTEAQADAVAEHLGRPDDDAIGRFRDELGNRFGGGRHGGYFAGRAGGVVSEALTDLLGLDAAELREQLRDGATLADIAESQDVDVQAVIDELVGEVAERLDEAVADGRLDRAEADERLADATERITDLVTNGRPAHPGRNEATPSDD